MPRFLSYIRRGLAASVTTSADARGWPQMAQAEVVPHLDVEGLTQEVSRSLTLRGPGDVVKIDATMITHAEPVPGSRDCAPNFFPYVELSDPALPWMFTPAAPNGNGRLVPWLVLVVVQASETVRLMPLSRGAGMMLSISEAAGALLPDPSESYAWAHVEVPDGIDLQEAFDGGQMVARLLCPVRLDPRTAYIAALVPLFAQGAAAGLGRDVPQETGAPAPAWQATTESVDLPVYHHWQFTTGAVDFEELVRRLSPYKLGPTTGLHDLNLSRPRGGLDLALLGKDLTEADATVSFQGALAAPGATPRDWPEAHRGPFQTRLEEVLDPPGANDGGKYDALSDDPVVAPPGYGACRCE